MDSTARDMASSRFRWKPNEIHPSGVNARGERSRGSSCSLNESSTRSMGHSMAVWQTSPSPCAACPSPTENRAPGISIGKNNELPGTSSLQSMLPPERRGGWVEWRPGSSGGIPMTPMKGRRATVWPCWSLAVRASGSSFQSMRSLRSATPRRRVRSLSPTKVVPHVPVLKSATRTSRTMPGSAPRTATGPHSA